MNEICYDINNRINKWINGFGMGSVLRDKPVMMNLLLINKINRVVFESILCNSVVCVLLVC